MGGDASNRRAMGGDASNHQPQARGTRGPVQHACNGTHGGRGRGACSMHAMGRMGGGGQTQANISGGHAASLDARRSMFRLKPVPLLWCCIFRSVSYHFMHRTMARCQLSQS